MEPNIKSSHPDAWLTRRKRRNWKPDFTLIQLAARAEIYFICVDTIYLTSNIPVQFSVQASQLLTTGLLAIILKRAPIFSFFSSLLFF